MAWLDYEPQPVPSREEPGTLLLLLAPEEAEQLGHSMLEAARHLRSQPRQSTIRSPRGHILQQPK